MIYQASNGHLACQTEIATRARANQFTTVADPTDGKWHHVAYVYDQTAAGFIAIYIDGVQDTRSTNTIAWFWSPQEEIEIGASHDHFWSGFGGELGDVRIYTRLLGDSDIAQLAGLAVPVNLSFSINKTALALTWTQNGFVLQQNSNLANSSSWNNVASGNVSPVNVTVPQSGNMFYRLIKP